MPSFSSAKHTFNSRVRIHREDSL